MNFKWPAKPSNNISPWYVIARRLPFFPLLLIGRFLCFVAVLGAFGLHEAVREWDH